MHIVLSRTDSIGDVVLTLPMAGLIREKYPMASITFIGRKYTEPVIRLSKYIDRFIRWDDYEKLSVKEQSRMLKELECDWLIHVFPNKSLAKAACKAHIKNRIGTSHRTFHWPTCSRLISFSRRRSELHEAQLNCKLLAPLGVGVPELEEIKNYYGFSVDESLKAKVASWLDRSRKNIVLHPRSKGSAREWGLENFDRLIRILPEQNFKIFITGTAAEANLMSDFLDNNRERITDMTGKLSLEELIAFLSQVDGVVAASTGPLHLAAALGTKAVGIYPPIRPMHPGRWAPLGEQSTVLVKKIVCEECRKSLDCRCIREITPEMVRDVLMKNFIEVNVPG